MTRLIPTTDQEVDAEHCQELIRVPTPERLGMRKDDAETGECRAEPEQRLQELDEEVDPILQLVERAQSKEHPESSNPFHVPTAE